jgi:hypothetical protein
MKLISSVLNITGHFQLKIVCMKIFLKNLYLKTNHITTDTTFVSPLILTEFLSAVL